MVWQPINAHQAAAGVRCIVKLDSSKISNKDDLILFLSICFLLLLLGLVVYLAYAVDSFWAGFVAATVIWKWKAWFYEPVDRFLERNWPS